MTNKQLEPNSNANEFSSFSSKILRAAIVAMVIITMTILSGCGGKETPDVDNPEQNANATTGDAVSDENSPEALFEMGNDYYKSGNLDEAISAYKKAVEQKADYDAAWANLGAAYYAQQNLEAAEEAYLKAIALSPDDADVVYNLGAIYLQQSLASGAPDQEKVTEALEQINRAVTLNPNLAQPYYGLGVANQLSGNTEAAIEAFEKFLDLDDGSDSVATGNATKILQSLKSGEN
ncbi:MAG TPA: tetratricopeptide repeat protein [Chloroflexi bacterium]|nr:tetratricopeptide repeat protein [Chloroflexota bacterium]